MTEEERLMMADMLRRENNLLQYHQNSINNNMIFDEKGRPTTAYITGLVDPEQPERLYAIPAYDNISGKIINNEDELTDLAIERNYFENMPYTNRYEDDRDMTEEEHMELVRRLKESINRDGAMIQKIRGTYGRN
jgi:hypothetical protein|tara:strand:- start:32 stop:436 length:405 start_codon:yes stop_codon:yes gene_type:complete